VTAPSVSSGRRTASGASARGSLRGSRTNAGCRIVSGRSSATLKKKNRSAAVFERSGDLRALFPETVKIAAVRRKDGLPPRMKFQGHDGALANNNGSKESTNAAYRATDLNAAMVNDKSVCLN